jgi:hypothetical protein
MIQEPDVTLTDYGLAVEATLLAWLLRRKPAANVSLRTSFIWFYISIAVAAILGGTYHGFLPAMDRPAAAVMWRAVLITIGVTAFTGWRIGAQLLFSSAIANGVGRIAAVELAVYALVAIFLWQNFALAIVNYLPAVFFLIMSFAISFARSRDGAALVGLTGLVLTLVAAAVQQFGVSIHPLYFNHNALYHLLQGAALIAIFVAARKFVQQAPKPQVNYAYQA